MYIFTHKGSCSESPPVGRTQICYAIYDVETRNVYKYWEYWKEERV